jgi:2-polyprenyl-3-methyl-5-hydroxy-6-metoxy-1,4-benzoquinol methylase
LENALAEFDTFAAAYQDLVSDSVRLTGESSDYFAAYKAAYIARRVAPRPGTKVLDYGCGVGLLSQRLHNRLTEIQVDGFDPSKDSIARIDAALLEQGVFTSNLEALAPRYDVIVISNVLHHVKPTERADLVRQLASRLSEEGRLIAFEHNPINPLTRWAVSQCAFDEDAVLLPIRELAGHIRQAGLQITGRDYIVFFPRWLKWFRPLEASLHWCCLGAQYTVIAKSLS